MKKALSGRGVIAAECFAAKDGESSLTGLMLTVPCRCGLNRADTLRVSGNEVVAIRGRSILPLEVVNLTGQSLDDVLEFAKSGQRLAVAEFTARGLYDAYFLKLEVV